MGCFIHFVVLFEGKRISKRGFSPLSGADCTTEMLNGYAPEYVQLILNEANEIVIKYLSFNSIKVQLIQRTINLFCYEAIKFQFHKGSINTTNTDIRLKEQRRFQFHKGSINTQKTVCVSDLILSFNSIKVQLIQLDPYDRPKVYTGFNSIKVQLIQ